MKIDKQPLANIELAIKKRTSFIKGPHHHAFRLMNGFIEGLPQVVVEVYGRTLVFHDYSMDSTLTMSLLPFFKEALPWITSAILKKRRHKNPREQAGSLIFGKKPNTQIVENDISYAIDLLMNQDASFYLDTRELRGWLSKHMKDKEVLNTFAYTGSLGIAALVGGASEVIQLDLNRRFLSLALRSASLNKLNDDNQMLHCADFWSRIKHFNRQGRLFDCIILDPPVYSKTSKGNVDITKNFDKLINKVRPLIRDGGKLITINNALFQSGKDHYQVLQNLCKNDYLSISKILPVPTDCIGHSTTPLNKLPSDPSPYNHATKITILNVKKK